jgi:hypothetical protein
MRLIIDLIKKSVFFIEPASEKNIVLIFFMCFFFKVLMLIFFKKYYFNIVLIKKNNFEKYPMYHYFIHLWRFCFIYT